MKTLQKKSVMALAGFAVLLANLNGTAQAQNNQFPRNGLIAVFTNNPVALNIVTNLLNEPRPPLSVPVVSHTNNYTTGTYWTLTSPAPLPMNPFPDLDVYSIGSNQFIIDDRSVDYATLEAENASNNPVMFQPMGLTYDTNGLYIQVPTNSLATPNVFTVNVMNTIIGQSYDILVKSDLLLQSWMPVLTTNAVASVTQVQVPRSDTNLFIWARESTGGTTFYINMPPLNQTVEDGDSVTFSVETGGNTNLTYQWTYNGVAIDGATNSSYTINNVQDGDAGQYAVTVSDGTNQETTPAAQLTTDSTSPFGYAQTGNANLIPILGSRQDYTFKSGNTYYISSATVFYGKTTIEGGTVIKPDWYSGGNVQIIGTLDVEAEPYYPAIFTSVDDDSVGEYLGFSQQDGAPFTDANGIPYLDLTYAQTNTTVGNVQIKFADIGITTPEAATLDVWDSQFFQCNRSIVNLANNGADNLHNVLFADCYAAVAATTNLINITGEQVTADVSRFCLASNMPTRIALTNSLYFGTTLSASSLSTVSVIHNPNNTNFTYEGYGNYYLAANSPLHNAGSASISPRLQSELQHKTTYAPVPLAVNTTISGDMTLSPQAQRYTNGAPDIGYYYDALDYTVANFTLAGGNLTILPNTAIAVRNDYNSTNGSYTVEGFFVQQGSSITSHGTPAKPNIFTAEKLVQETPETDFAAYKINNGWWFGGITFVTDSEPDAQNSTAAVYDFRFSKLYLPPSDYHFWSGYDEYGDYALEVSPDSSMYLSLQDCQLHGGRINLGNPDQSYYSTTQVYPVGALSWINNSFENTAISLDPTYYRANGVVNCDMQLAAYNNLFKGGSWLLLEPFPASAGNWTFRDNLFDKVNFLQDASQPLDFDHNGYWPLLPREFPYGGSAGELTASTGGTDGGNEVTLSNAPPYQIGAFGKFYLPDTTPLYGAGSRSPADAGLFQYTTRLDQTKEGDETAGHMVNLGVHYVAATGNVPKDTDGDGVPDYVEDANGNGVVDFNVAVNANETDWQNPITDGATNDAYSVAYDDVDLSGDGLVGRIKKALGLNPFDENNPLAAAQITTGEEPEIATFEVPISYDTLTNIGTLRLIVDSGQSGFYQECDRATNGNCLLEWNITFDSPGQHYIQPQLVLGGKRGGGTAPDTRILAGSGTFGSYNSTNVCQFDPADSEFTDDGATLYATTPTCPDANYTIEIQTPTGQHIKTITNSTSNGVISENWDLTDDNGNPVTNDAVNAVFRVTLLDPDYGQLIFPLHRVPKTMWDDGNFTIAYAWDNSYQAQHSMHDAIQYGIVDPFISPPESGGSGSFNHYDSTFNDYTWSGDLNGNPGWLSGTNVVTALTNNLADPDTKNFYFDGHGNIDSIGDSRSASDPNSITINSDDISKLLLNKVEKISFILHPYRFVFLNACDTAGANFWAHAFGIRDKITDAVATRTGHPQAFVGWFNEARAPSTDDDWNDMGETYAVFSGAWMSGWPLEDCIRAASSTHPPAPFDSYYLNFPFGKDWPWYEYEFPSIYGRVLPFHIKIFGYAGLTRSSFEHGYDNSPYYK